MTTLEIILLIVAAILFAMVVYAAHRIEELEERNERNVNFLLGKMVEQDARLKGDALFVIRADGSLYMRGPLSVPTAKVDEDRTPEGDLPL